MAALQPSDSDEDTASDRELNIEDELHLSKRKLKKATKTIAALIEQMTIYKVRVVLLV